jgi:hypothetical protein
VYFETASTLPVVKAKSKHSMLPILTFLFLLSYGLMVLLVVEQNRTITSQRWVITELMSDSKELTSLKGKLNAQQQQHAPAPAPKAQPHTPSPQAPVQEKKNGTANSKLRRNQDRPPRLTSDTADARRALHSI